MRHWIQRIYKTQTFHLLVVACWYPFITFWHWRTFISSISLHVSRSVYAVFWWYIHRWRFTCQFITHGPLLAVLISSSVKIISLTKKNSDL